MRRRTLLAASLAAAVGGLAAVAGAQEMKFFRIGTGGTAAVYFPIGGLIANAISNPPGSRACAEGGSCGVPGLVATAVASNGSVANVAAVNAGSLESGFSQSDIAYWAYTGTGLFEGRARFENLRAIANLYPESVHLVARRGAAIKSVRDLKGKRVSLDEPGSGTLVGARIILAAYDVAERELKAEYVKANVAGDKLRDGTLDAFFFVGGYPVGAISELATVPRGIELVPIDGPEAAKLLAEYKFFAPGTIPAGVYGESAAVETLSINAIWVTSAKIDAELIYGVARALWNENTRKLLDAGHAKGKAIQSKTALDGIGIPLHPGAEKFYREVGLLK